jgi:hypothetical protein
MSSDRKHVQRKGILARLHTLSKHLPGEFPRGGRPLMISEAQSEPPLAFPDAGLLLVVL